MIKTNMSTSQSFQPKGCHRSALCQFSFVSFMTSSEKFDSVYLSKTANRQKTDVKELDEEEIL